MVPAVRGVGRLAHSEGFTFRAVRGLSAEATERLERARPTTVGQARRLPGITPAAVGLLLVHLKRTGLFQVER